MMNKMLKFGTIVYGLVLAGCLFAFAVQQYVIEDQMSRNRQHVNGPYVVEIREKDAEKATEVELRLINTALSSSPLSLTNELEEHILSLLVANLATGVFLVFAVVNLSKQLSKRDIPTGPKRSGFLESLKIQPRTDEIA
jgi:hypothetical protein